MAYNERAGAVLYVKDMTAMARFYATVAHSTHRDQSVHAIVITGTTAS